MLNTEQSSGSFMQKIKSATFSFYTFSEIELMNQIVPFTIYFELKFHPNLTILKVTTSFCCLPPLAPPCAWFITDLGQVLTSTGNSLAPGCCLDGTMLACWSNFWWQTSVTGFKDMLQCIQFWLRAACM